MATPVTFSSARSQASFTSDDDVAALVARFADVSKRKAVGDLVAQAVAQPTPKALALLATFRTKALLTIEATAVV